MDPVNQPCLQHFASVAPPWVEVRLDRLRANIRAARAVLRKPTELMFIVKANAYGHGIRGVARTAAEEGVKWFGVAYLSEALEVRAAAPDARILVLGVVSPLDVPTLLEQGITPVVVSRDHGEAFSAEAERLGRTLAVHVKTDTGMGRLGIPCEEAPQALRTLFTLAGLKVEGLCSHFAAVELGDPAGAQEQYRRFDAVLNATDRPLFRHLSSSRAFSLYPEWDYDAVRSGIALYGYGAADPSMRFSTEPVLEWKTTITQVRKVPRGTPVGYYGTYVTPHETRIAVIAAGYADGYLRSLSNRGDVLVAGRRCRVVGRVSMNWITVDLGMETPAQVGDEVVLVGQQGLQSVWADELAAKCRTIAYEVLTFIHPSLERRYLG